MGVNFVQSLRTEWALKKELPWLSPAQPTPRSLSLQGRGFQWRQHRESLYSCSLGPKTAVPRAANLAPFSNAKWTRKYVKLIPKAALGQHPRLQNKRPETKWTATFGTLRDKSITITETEKALRVSHMQNGTVFPLIPVQPGATHTLNHECAAGW